MHILFSSERDHIDHIIDLNDTHRMMMMITMMMMMLIVMMKPQNGHNLAHFEATISKFCMLIDINNTSRLYFHGKF